MYLTYEQAVALLPDGEAVHVFMNPGVNILVGADWSRAEVLELLRGYRPELSGAQATALGHGLVVLRGGEPAFIATDAQALAQFHAAHQALEA
jgi:2-keto-3-deoxy-galactonokinase